MDDEEPLSEADPVKDGPDNRRHAAANSFIVPRRHWLRGDTGEAEVGVAEQAENQFSTPSAPAAGCRYEAFKHCSFGQGRAAGRQVLWGAPRSTNQLLIRGRQENEAKTNKELAVNKPEKEAS